MIDLESVERDTHTRRVNALLYTLQRKVLIKCGGDMPLQRVSKPGKNCVTLGEKQQKIYFLLFILAREEL